MSENLIILGIGISSHKTDGVIRFEKYCRAYGLEYMIVGEGIPWRGGNMNDSPGGGHKIIEVLNTLRKLDNRLIVICDTFDLFPVAGQDEIIKKYCRLCGIQKPTDEKHKIVISSEVYCWPNKSLVNVYPNVSTKYKYLNSGCIMGFRDEIYNLLENNSIKDTDDDQLFYTMQYLNGKNIILDHGCLLFQTLSGTSEDIVIHKNRVYNKYANTYPSFIHGNGNGKLLLNHIENYIACEPFIDYNLIDTTHNPEPKIFIALYVDSSKYKSNDLFMSHFVDIHYNNKVVYVYDKALNSDNKLAVEQSGYIYKISKEYVFDDFLESDCQYYFLLDQKCIITDKNILHNLLPHMKDGQRILCPLLRDIHNIKFTNYWGALSNIGYYKRSDDYLDIIAYNKRGLWNVPYVAHAILFDRNIILNWNITQKNKFSQDDIDMALCYNLRRETCFMYMINLQDYGYLNLR